MASNDIDTAAIRADMRTHQYRDDNATRRITMALCDALDAARTESEALRREQIYAVRLAEAAEAECVRHATRSEELENALDAVCVEALGYLDRAEAAEALGGKDAIRRRRAEANAETWRIAQASAAGMLLDVQRDCIAERQRAEAAEARIAELEAPFHRVRPRPEGTCHRNLHYPPANSECCWDYR